MIIEGFGFVWLGGTIGTALILFKESDHTCAWWQIVLGSALFWPAILWGELSDR